MRIHKRLIEYVDSAPLVYSFIRSFGILGGGGGFSGTNYWGGNYSLNAPTEVVKQIIINIEAGVEVEVTIAA